MRRTLVMYLHIESVYQGKIEIKDILVYYWGYTVEGAQCSIWGYLPISAEYCNQIFMVPFNRDNKYKMIGLMLSLCD